MAQTMSFGEILEAADQLSPDEQETLIAILRRRLIDQGRLRLAAEIQEARQEFAEGRVRPSTTDEILQEILS